MPNQFEYMLMPKPFELSDPGRATDGIQYTLQNNGFKSKGEVAATDFFGTYGMMIVIALVLIILLFIIFKK